MSFVEKLKILKDVSVNNHFFIFLGEACNPKCGLLDCTIV